MKVALLSRAAHPLHPPGGLERAVFDLARHLQDRGIETVLFTRPPTQPGVFPGEVRHVPYGPRSGRAHGRVFDRVLYYPRFALRMGSDVARLVREGAVDIVHAQGLTALGYGLERLRDASLRAPLVMNPQGMEEHKSAGLKRLALTRIRRLSRQAASVADRVIATDESTRGEVESLLGVAPARICVIENAIDLGAVRGLTPADPKAYLKDAFPFLAGAFPVLLSVGRVEAYKGFADILGALRILEERRVLPARWAWVLVGDGSFRADLVKLLKGMSRDAKRGNAPEGDSFAERVHVVGRVSDEALHALYARADVFVHATRYEGSSLVTLEAMAHGLAIVATRAGGIPDKIEDGVHGRLAEIGDVASLARSLEDLIADAALRARMGTAARLRAEERFSWERAIDKTLDLYYDLLSAGAA